MSSSNTGRELASDTIWNLLTTPGATRTCLGCEHFTEQGDTCALFKAKPPFAVLVKGCPKYDPKVPF